MTDAGCASYVNGALVGVSGLPPGRVLSPGCPLFAFLPVAGNAGESARWRVLKAFWGTSDLDEQTAVEFGKLRGVAKTLLPTSVRITGLVAGVGVEEVAAGMRVPPRGVRLDGPGAAVVDFGSEEAARAVLGAPPGAFAVRGGAVVVGQAWA